jgi:hypothetical protein
MHRPIYIPEQPASSKLSKLAKSKATAFGLSLLESKNNTDFFNFAGKPYTIADCVLGSNSTQVKTTSSTAYASVNINAQITPKQSSNLLLLKFIVGGMVAYPCFGYQNANKVNEGLITYAYRNNSPWVQIGAYSNEWNAFTGSDFYFGQTNQMWYPVFVGTMAGSLQTFDIRFTKDSVGASTVNVNYAATSSILILELCNA